MASYNELLALIDAYINRNGVQAITGQILNGVLKAMVDQLGRGYTLMGYAEPTGDPGTPDGPESWFASVPGTYTNYGEIQVAAGELALLSFAPSEGWTKNTIYEGFREVTATADDNIGFPQVGVTYANGVLSFDFKNIKGEPGENGDPAGFGSVTASVDDQVGTPSVSVSSSGPDTAKNFAFAFHNLKGETGVTSVVATVDNTSGNPQCSVSLQGGQLTLAFTGLKGAQGNTGSSVDYPFTIVNNLTTDDPTQALSAAMGVQLESEVSQLEAKVGDLDTTVNGGTTEEYVEQGGIAAGYFRSNGTTIGNRQTSSSGTWSASYDVQPGDKFRITGIGGNNYSYLFITTDANKNILRHAEQYADGRTSPVCVTIQSGEAYIFINLSSYDSTQDKIEKAIEERSGGLVGTVAEMATQVADNEEEITDVRTIVNGVFEDSSESIDNTILTNTRYESGTSAFSGWGMPLCENKTISAITVNVYNRDSSAMSQIKFWIRKDDMNGDILAQKTVAVNIAPGSSADVTCELEAPVTYSGLIYVQYACDKLVTRLGWLDATNYPYKRSLGYPGCSYASNGNDFFTESSSDESAFWVQYFVPFKQLTDAQVANIGERLQVEPESRHISVDLPDTIYAVVGDTLQLYYKSIFRCVDPYIYDIKVSCTIGAQYPRYYELKPTSGQIGERNITFTIKDNDNNVLGTKTVTLKVVNKVNNPGAKNILCVGASNTNGGNWPGELKKRLTTASGTPTVSGGQTLFTPIGFSIPNLTFVGRKIANDVNLEATGGYNFNTYITASAAYVRFFFTQENAPTVSIGDTYTDGTTVFTVAEINIPDLNELQGYYGNINFAVSSLPASVGLTLTRVSGNGDATLTASASSMSGNPFVYDGEINIGQYADDYCGGQIDIVYTELFGNGLVYQYQTDFTDTFAKMQSFIDMFLAVFPNCKFCINIMQNKDEKGGLGKNYGAGTTPYAYPYGLKFGCQNLLPELQKYIKDNNLENTVFIVNTLNEFDCENDYRQTVKQVNPRSGVTEIFGVNGAHPSDIGYFQMADAAVRAFIAHFCQ